MSDLFDYVSAAESLAGVVEDQLFAVHEKSREAALHAAWVAYVQAYDRLFESSFSDDTFTLRGEKRD